MAFEQNDPRALFSPFLYRFFAPKLRSYVKKGFHAVRVSRRGNAPELEGRPAVLYLNHPSWWDPLIGLVLAQEKFPEYTHFAPIEQKMLDKYRFMRKLGFFGLDPTCPKSISRFVRTSRQLLQQPRTLLWITAAGQFADPRDRSIPLQRGLGLLAARKCAPLFVPLALEYPFWEERFPEALCRFGEPISLDARNAPESKSSRDWTLFFETRLAQVQDALAREALGQSGAPFETLSEGRVGIGGVYDLWRSFRAKLTGREFHREHGSGEDSTRPRGGRTS